MTRSLIIASCIFTFFALAPSALADAGCTYESESCISGGVSGTCNASFVCVVANPPSNVTPGNPPSNTTPGVTLINPLKGGASLESFLGNILDFVIRIGAIVVVLILVYIGYLFVVAQGSDTKLTEAKKALLWTIIGALVLLGAVAIKDGIIATVNAISVGQ